jgi:2-keto-4-pentenoate hydratase/2-oxohepta-3-ene-1,7-dioic acid hydratase in catechol pathway
MTVRQGTVVVIGTPPDVGFSREPKWFLGHEDMVEVRVQGIGVEGRLCNRFVFDRVDGEGKGGG